jgi:hypothetical protein
MKHHPWRSIDADVHVEVRDLPADIDGYCVVSERLIVLARGLTQAERRSTLVHEHVHLERGDIGPCTPRQEASVDQAAAHRLIDAVALGDALCWAHDIYEAADELWVDVATLRTRLAHLHPSEKHYLRRRLAARDNEGEA